MSHQSYSSASDPINCYSLLAAHIRESVSYYDKLLWSAGADHPMLTYSFLYGITALSDSLCALNAKLRRPLLTRLYLIRHRETLWNTEGRLQGRMDSPLTATGLQSEMASVSHR